MPSNKLSDLWSETLKILNKARSKGTYFDIRVDGDDKLKVFQVIKGVETEIFDFHTTGEEGDITSVSAGVGLSGGGTSGAVSLALDARELTALGTAPASGDFIVVQDITDNSTKKVTVSNLTSTIDADITSVVAGSGLTGGATEGAATLNVGAGTGITVNSDDIAVDGVLEDLDTLGAPGSDGQFIVATGAGAFQYESGATARTSLGVDAAGTDNSTNVTIASGRDYITISGQELTLGQVDISDDTNLAASTGITLTGDTLTTNDSEIVHDNLSGFVANEHVDHSSVSITAGTGLSGGGDLTTTRTLNIDLTDVISSDGANRVLTTDGDGTLTARANITVSGDDLTVGGEVKTTKISYTDGDDAITIEDGGTIFLHKGMRSSPAVEIASPTSSQDGKWIKILEATSTLSNYEAPEVVALVTLSPMGYSGGGGVGNTQSFIISARWSRNGTSASAYTGHMFLTAEPVHGKTLDSWDPTTHLVMTYDNNDEASIHIKSTSNYTAIFVSILGGHDYTDSHTYTPNGWVVATGNSFETTLTSLGAELYGVWADKTFNDVTAASLDISGDVDVDGTLEADAITVNGTALDTHIAGVTVTNATSATTATNADNVDIDTTGANASYRVVLVDSSGTDYEQLYVDNANSLTFNPSSNILTTNDIVASEITATHEVVVNDGGGDTLVKLYDSSDDGIVDVYQNNSVKARIHGNGDSYFTGGDLGVGTSSPAAKLHVNRNATVGNIGGLTLGNAGVKITDSSTNMYIDGNSINTDANTYLNVSADYDLYFGTNDTERMRIKNNGLVGIGTDSPNAGLHIDISGEPQLLLDGGDNSHGDLVVPDGEIMQIGHWNNGTDTFTGRITMDSDGDIGFGVASPDSRLHINCGTTNTAKEDGIRLAADNDDWYIYPKRISSSTTNVNLQFNADGNDYGFIDDGGSNDQMNFTGQHRCLADSSTDFATLSASVGKIVISSGEYDNPTNESDITINESIPTVKLSNKRNQKSVFGVVSNAEDPDQQERTYNFGAFGTNRQKKSPDDVRIHINSLGEGAIWVCNTNGALENGDYITTCEIPGYGMKQDSEMLCNYTVAKITMDCNFDLNAENYECVEIQHDGVTYRAAFVGCTYHCG